MTSKYITIKLTEDQAYELEQHLKGAIEFEIFPEHKHFLNRILNKLAKAKTV